MNANPQVEDASGFTTKVTLKLKPHGLRSLKNAAKIATDRELSERLGVNQSNLSRILKGTAKPGIPFVAGCLNVFGPYSVDCLFEIVPDPTRIGRRDQGE